MKPDFFNKIYSEEFLREYISKNQLSKNEWELISVAQYLSGNFIRDFKNHVVWKSISKNQELSEEIIREFKDEVKWEYISKFQKVSENFLGEFKDYIYWNHIYWRELSEEFMRKFKNKIYWMYACKYQALSICFIDEMIQEELITPYDYKLLLENEKINQEELIAYFSMCV